MSRVLRTQPLTAEAFAPFGDVLEVNGPPDKIINQGMCGRHHDRAVMDFGPDGRAGISIFDAQAYTLPLLLEMMERHPDGSQAFLPTGPDPFLVVVAPDADGVPGSPIAFLTRPGQGVNYARNTWHAVCTPLDWPAKFFVVDRIGPGANLQEHWFDQPYTIEQ